MEIVKSAAGKRKLCQRGLFSLLVCLRAACQLVRVPAFAHSLSRRSARGAVLRSLASRSLSQAASRSPSSLFCSGLLFGTAPCPAAAPVERALISFIACTLWCCDSPTSWQGQPNLRWRWGGEGVYRPLRCIMPFLLSFVCRETPLMFFQTTVPKVEWRQSSLRVAHTMTTCFLTHHMTL